MDADYTQYEGFVNFFETPVFSTLLKLRNRVVMVITGNRFGKTKSLQRKNVYRLMGLSPNPEHNIKPEDRCRVMRLAAENLPGYSGKLIAQEVKQ